MRTYVYPADDHGCGHHRLIWPAEQLRRAGADVVVMPPDDRRLSVAMRDGVVTDVKIPGDADVIVFQRITHAVLVKVIGAIRERGVAVVVDVDDDLQSIHPGNVAFGMLHPRRFVDSKGPHGESWQHSWNNLLAACRAATLVTMTTPALGRTYASAGRGVVVPNYLADHYYGIKHADSDVIGWPAALNTHPNDPDVVGVALRRLVDAGATFHVVGDADGCARAFRLAEPPASSPPVGLLDWPAEVARLGIGVAPLADTRFNAAKSWLKPLELAAVGVPWVGSPRTEYRRLHELGCGVLVDRPRDWYQALSRLRANPTWRAELSDAGRRVAEGLRLRDHAWRWQEAFARAYELERHPSRRGSVVLN